MPSMVSWKTPPSTVPIPGNIYLVLEYHTGDFLGRCMSVDHFTVRVQVTDRLATDLVIGSIVELSRSGAVLVLKEWA